MSGISKVWAGRQLPHLHEHIWQKILRDFTLSEWASAAGVCKTTWSLQIDYVCVDRKLDFEGWTFLLQRCREAKSFQLHPLQDRAAFMHALSLDPYNFQMKKLQVLQATDASLFEAFQTDYMAQVQSTGAILDAAPNIQVLVTERPAYCLSAMPYLPRLRHLIWGDYNIAQLCPLLASFYALRTLVLGGSSTQDYVILDLAHLRALEHLHIINFAPQSIAACKGCKLHVSWDEEARGANKDFYGLTNWLESSLWASLALPLSSLKLSIWGRLSERGMSALGTLLNQEAPLDFIFLAVWSFGSESEPIQISKQHWQGMLTAKRLLFSTTTTCHLRFLNDWPSWTHLRIHAQGGIQMEAEGMQGTLKALQHCSISGSSFRCTFMEQMSASTCTRRVGSALHSRAIGCHAFDPSCQRGPLFPPSLSRVEGSAETEGISSSMFCGCHACLPCLRRDGVLSEDVGLQHDPNQRFFSHSFCAGTRSSISYTSGIEQWESH